MLHETRWNTFKIVFLNTANKKRINKSIIYKSINIQQARAEVWECRISSVLTYMLQGMCNLRIKGQTILHRKSYEC